MTWTVLQPVGFTPYSPDGDYEVLAVDTFEDLPDNPEDLEKRYIRAFHYTATFVAASGQWYNETGGVVTSEG